MKNIFSHLRISSEFSISQGLLTINQIVDCAQKNNIPENIHPHLLRHSFASHVLQSSQDLRAVQELLGHSNISTTQIYTHLDFQHLSKIYDQAHPRSKKKID